MFNLPGRRGEGAGSGLLSASGQGGGATGAVAWLSSSRD